MLPCETHSTSTVYSRDNKHGSHLWCSDEDALTHTTGDDIFVAIESAIIGIIFIHMGMGSTTMSTITRNLDQSLLREESRSICRETRPEESRRTHLMFFGDHLVILVG